MFSEAAAQCTCTNDSRAVLDLKENLTANIMEGDLQDPASSE
jgi:hypothetical protein